MEDSKIKLENWIIDMQNRIDNTDNVKYQRELWEKLHHVKINLKHFYHRRIDNNEYHHFCKECGQIELATYDNPTKERLINNQLCFGCDLWKAREKKLLKNPGKSVIIDGVLWTDGGRKDKTRTDFLGCAGREFMIRMLDGSKEWSTNNLWCGGGIPKKYRETTLRDTAEFVK